MSSEQWKEKAAKHLRQPSVLLKAYCGSELSIGVEIAVQVATPHHAVNGVVLVQKDTPVHMLLETDLMSAQGIRVLEGDGQFLLVPFVEEPQPVRDMEQPQPVRVVEQLQPVQDMEQPQPVRDMEQPQPVQVMEQPPPVQVMEQPPPVQVMEQPPPVQLMEQPTPVRDMEQPQTQPVSRCPACTEGELESEQHEKQSDVTAVSFGQHDQKSQMSTTGVLQPAVDDTSRGLKSLSPCLKIGNRRYSVHAYSEDGQGPGSTHSTPATGKNGKSPVMKRIPVHLI